MNNFYFNELKKKLNHDQFLFIKYFFFTITKCHLNNIKLIENMYIFLKII